MFTAQTIEIARPVEVVFPYIADVANFAQWLERTAINVEHDAPGVVGTRWHQVSVSSGLPLRMWGEVTRCVPNRLFSYRVGTSVLMSFVDIRLVEIAGGTRVLSDWRMEPQSRVMRWLVFVLGERRFGERMAAESRKGLAGLKAALERTEAVNGAARTTE